MATKKTKETPAKNDEIETTSSTAPEPETAPKKPETEPEKKPETEPDTETESEPETEPETDPEQVDAPWLELSPFEKAAAKTAFNRRVELLLKGYSTQGVMKAADRFAKLKKEQPALFKRYTADMTPQQIKDLLPKKK